MKLSKLNQVIEVLSKKYRFAKDQFELDQHTMCIVADAPNHCKITVSLCHIFQEWFDFEFVYTGIGGPVDLMRYDFHDKHFSKYKCKNDMLRFSEGWVSIRKFPSGLTLHFRKHPKTTIENAIESSIQELKEWYECCEHEHIRMNGEPADRYDYIPFDGKAHHIILTRKIKGN